MSNLLFRSLFISSLIAEDIFKWEEKTIGERLHEKLGKYIQRDGFSSYFDYNKIFVVDNEKNAHWTFYCIFLESKTIAFYDSFNGKPGKGKGCQKLLEMMEQLARIVKHNIDLKEWSCIQVKCRDQVC